MKKILVLLIAILAAKGAFCQTISVVNNTNCDITIEIDAEDLPAYSACALQSNLIVVSATSTYGPIANLGGITSGSTWLGSAMPTSSGTGWDAVKFYFSSVAPGGCGGWVGQSCGAPAAWAGSCCGNTANTATWAVVGGNYVVTIN